MVINKLLLTNYRCFENLEVEFNEKLSVIVGANGAGKTTVLEGASVALGTFFTGIDDASGVSISPGDAHMKVFPMGESDDVQPQYPVGITATGEENGRTITWKRSLNGKNGKTTIVEAAQMIAVAKEYQDRLRAGDKTLVLPLIAYYGTGRLWDYHREKKSDVFKGNKKTNGYINSLDGTANLKLMMNWFRKKTVQMYQKLPVGLKSSNELVTVYSAMEKCYKLVTGKENKIIYNLDTNEINCCYKDENGLQMCMPLSLMSDGYKGTLSLIADIAYRMVVLNPQLSSSALSETPGVVLIDEIDLHLHPAWQHRILADLQAIFPKLQFIVTTHAPAVISSVKSENLVILGKDGVTDVAAQTYGNDANTILTDVMGVTERNPEVASLFARFEELLVQKQFDEAEKVLDTIDEQRDFHDKEVVADRVKLRVERIRGGS